MNDERLDEAIAALSRELEPARDLWPEIDARLGNRQAARRFEWLTGSLVLAAAAAVVLVVGLDDTRDAPTVHEFVQARAGDADTQAPESSSVASPGLAEEPASMGPDLLLAHPWLGDYETAASSLEAAYHRRRADLEPDVVNVVETNLVVVDQALVATQLAFADAPDDPDLLAMVQDAYEHKLDLLDPTNFALEQLP